MPGLTWNLEGQPTSRSARPCHLQGRTLDTGSPRYGHWLGEHAKLPGPGDGFGPHLGGQQCPLAEPGRSADKEKLRNPWSPRPRHHGPVHLSGEAPEPQLAGGRHRHMRSRAPVAP
jgi:hypothetical protein